MSIPQVVAVNTIGNQNLSMNRRPLTKEEIACKDRLKRIWDARKDELGLTQLSAGEKMGMSQGAVGHYLRGRNPLNAEAILKFAELLRVSPRKIDPNLFKYELEPVSETGGFFVGSNGKVPLISWVQAGYWGEIVDNFQPGDAEDWMFCPRPHGPNTFALQVSGDSMTAQVPGQKSYPHGTIIFADPDKSLTNGARVVARINGYDEATFKVYKEDMGRKKLVPINTVDYDPIDITDMDVTICGVVIGKYEPE